MPAAPAGLRLQLVTPLRLGDPKKTRQKGLPLTKLMMAIVRRISMLQYFYAGRQLEADFAALKEQSESLKPVTESLQWMPCQRFSSHYGRHLDTSGWMGYIDINLSRNPDIWSFLYLGQWLQVGKNASMGYGRYRVLTR